MSQHVERWNQLRQLLRNAQQSLPEGVRTEHSPRVPDGLLRGTLQEFEEFLEHDEFELAWDALAELAKRTGATPDLWNNLAQAAALMKLTEKETEATSRALQSKIS